jgi:DNA-binding transcriptional MerR regulator
MTEELSVDQLAQRTGVPSSTIRMYQTRGLLPKPRREGRVGRYGPAHEARLQLISQLQARGYSLAAIGELVESWEDGRSLDDVLGLEHGAVTAFAGGAPIDITVDELQSRFAQDDLTPDDVRRAVELGLAELLPDGRVRVRSPEFLEAGAELRALGIPMTEVFDAQARVRADLDAIADRFASLFERYVWRPFADAGMPDDQLADVTAAIDRLGPLARSIVDANLRAALQDAAAGFLDAEARRRRSP